MSSARLLAGGQALPAVSVLPHPPAHPQVLAERERQIREKMERNRLAQEESVQCRAQLISELEEAQRLTQREREEEAGLRSARKQELEAQVGAPWQSRPEQSLTAR